MYYAGLNFFNLLPYFLALPRSYRILINKQDARQASHLFSCVCAPGHLLQLVDFSLLDQVSANTATACLILGTFDIDSKAPPHLCPPRCRNGLSSVSNRRPPSTAYSPSPSKPLFRLPPSPPLRRLCCPTSAWYRHWHQRRRRPSDYARAQWLLCWSAADVAQSTCLKCA